MGAAVVLMLVAFGALAAGVLIGRYYVPDDRQLRRTARHSRAYMRALSNLIARDHDTVVSELRAVVEENVDDVEPYFALGAMFRSKGEHERAIRVHQALAVRERDKKKLRQRAMYELGLDFRAAGMPRRATRAMEEVLLEEPNHEGALRALAALYEEQARFNEAAGLWARLGKRRNEDTSLREHHLLVAAAQSALGRGDADSAKQLLKAAQREHETAHFFAAAAELAGARGNHRGAKERLKQALVSDPALAPHLLPGLIAAEQGLATAESKRTRSDPSLRLPAHDELEDDALPAGTDAKQLPAGESWEYDTTPPPPSAAVVPPNTLAAASPSSFAASGAASSSSSSADAPPNSLATSSAAAPPNSLAASSSGAPPNSLATSSSGAPPSSLAASSSGAPPNSLVARSSNPAMAAASSGASGTGALAGMSGAGGSIPGLAAALPGAPGVMVVSVSGVPSASVSGSLTAASSTSMATSSAGALVSAIDARAKTPPQGVPLVPPVRPPPSIVERVLAVLAEVEAETGPRLELALIRAQLVPPADDKAVAELATELVTRFPEALAARVATARLALRGNDVPQLRTALEVLVADHGALAWALRGRWQCANCGNRPGPFSWRCGQCRRWNTLRMETGVEPPPLPPRERRSSTRMARPEALLGAAPDESLPVATLDPGLSDDELARAGTRRSLLGRVGGWVSNAWRRDR